MSVTKRCFSEHSHGNQQLHRAEPYWVLGARPDPCPDQVLGGPTRPPVVVQREVVNTDASAQPQVRSCC